MAISSVVRRSSRAAEAPKANCCGVDKTNPPRAQVRHADIISAASKRLAGSGADSTNAANVMAAPPKSPASMAERASP
jgi:hypothetical protein